ncbi:GDSL-type esterase/lipase family protein [Negadavirga shengliensis]|uniref:GDSL-type esterase/lipase family protein n=1 Tax=Negadavirga shengliensis TaxID=1389218 RepID=A0ABV9T166_9BACT
MKTLLFVLLIWMSHYVIAQDTVKIACVGNSITEGPGRNHKNSYPLQMQKLLGSAYQVKNFGVSGRTLLKKGDFPYWNEPQFDQVKEFHPDVLVIKLGTNDSKPQNWRYKEDFQEDYIELVETYKQHMPKDGRIYICLPVPVFQDEWGISESILVQEMRPILEIVSEKTGAQIIDLHKPLEDRADLFPDGVHPSEDGAAIMAKVIAESIRKDQ